MRARRFYLFSAKRGLRGPYSARQARMHARIAKAQGRRVARFQRVGFDPGAAIMFLSALHAERRVPPGYSRSKKGKGLHGENATLYLYENKDVYVLPDASELSGYRVPGGSKELDVSGSLSPYWLIVDLSQDGRTWKRIYNAPASGEQAGSFIALAPLPTPFIRETWYKRTPTGWKKQGSTDNW